MTDDEKSLLRAVLRARPGTRAELEDLAASVVREPEPVIAGLVRRGFLTLSETGAVMTIAPTSVAELRLADALGQMRRDLATLTGEAMAAFEDLDGLLEASRVGGADRGGLEVEFVHGPEAPRDASVRLTQRRGPVTSCAVLPDARRLQAPPPEFLAAFVAMMRAKSAPDRVLLGRLSGHDDDLTSTMSTVRSAGAELRVSASLPSWFAVDADDYVALPLSWGESWPSTVMLVRHPAVAGAMRQLFESLWVSAPPFGVGAPSWLPLVQLLETGATLAQAADLLGISERTARRRLTEAMTHHRARTLFQLGAAVARSPRG